jgi:hypothetical protein
VSTSGSFTEIGAGADRFSGKPIGWTLIFGCALYFLCVLPASFSFSLYYFTIYGELFGCFFFFFFFFGYAKNFSVAFEILPGTFMSKPDVIPGVDELTRKPPEHRRVQPSAVDASSILAEGSKRSRQPVTIINVARDKMDKDGDEYSSGFESAPPSSNASQRAILKAPFILAIPLSQLKTGTLRTYRKL